MALLLGMNSGNYPFCGFNVEIVCTTIVVVWRGVWV